MGLFDKFKNIFTEEVEEEEVKKEVRQVEIVSPKELEEVKVETKEEEKINFPIYFDDKDFEELDHPKEIEVKKEPPKKELYGIKNKEVRKTEKKFVPSPVISPVYGVLNKNYKNEDVVDKNNYSRSEYHKTTRVITLDDVRKKAYGTLEDELENSLFNDDPIYMEKEIEEDLFDELERTQELFKKEEIVEELLKKDEVVEVLENRIIDDYKNVSKESLDDNLMLEEINKLPIEEDLKISESDLFSLIDAMYEKDDENGND